MKKRIALRGIFGGVALATVFPILLVASPEIVTGPTNQTAMVGLPVRMSVAASSFLPLTYQWTLTRDNVTPRTAVILNATNSVLVLPRPLSTSAGLYSAIVRDTSGSVTSDFAHLRLLSLQPQPNNLIKLEMWNNVFGTNVRIEITTNMVNSIANFNFDNVL